MVCEHPQFPLSLPLQMPLPLHLLHLLLTPGKDAWVFSKAETDSWALDPNSMAFQHPLTLPPSTIILSFAYSGSLSLLGPYPDWKYVQLSLNLKKKQKKIPFLWPPGLSQSCTYEDETFPSLCGTPLHRLKRQKNCKVPGGPLI